MTSVQPLLILLGQSEIERDAAQADLQRVLAAHQAAAKQAEQLLTYRRDYEQRWGTQFQTNGAMELVHCYRGFMDRLTQAVEQQQRVARHAAVQVDTARAALLATERTVAKRSCCACPTTTSTGSSPTSSHSRSRFQRAAR